jgi:aspartate 1-decarboxylase
MLLKILKGKIHRATVTEADLNYSGSLGIDESLMEAAGIINNEHIEVYNITNGERFTTYAIPSPRGSGRIFVYGAAAHLANKGDLLIICAFGLCEEDKAKKYHPKVVIVGPDNKIQVKKDHDSDG